MQRALIIYHANCLDGFGAAWVAEAVLSQDMDVDMVAASYGEEPPYDAVSKNTVVYILDFSYPRPEIAKLCSLADKVVLLDHHATALEALEGFEQPNLVLCLDKNHSGVGLAWRWFHPKTAMPAFLAAVQDRDLWQFKLPYTAEICAAIASYEMLPANWDDMAIMDIEDLISEGISILRMKKQLISDSLANGTTLIQILEYPAIPLVNTLPALSSDTGAMLLQMMPPETSFAAMYSVVGDKLKFSLRSTDSRVDVRQVAERFGGGGHRNAAGFSLRLGSYELSDFPLYIHEPLPPEGMFDEEEMQG